jgi:CheY-like chemotaxis protein
VADEERGHALIGGHQEIRHRTNGNDVQGSTIPLAHRLLHGRPERPSIRILVAEDDPVIGALVLEVVKDLGHAPSSARNGFEAWDRFNADGADVVVSDWMMPGMDGVELCRCVRERVDAPYTYFILLTALGDSEHRIAGMQAGADDYLSKPFALPDIEARLIAAQRVTALHRRREALLRQARRFAGETDPERLLNDLVREAIDLLGGSCGLVTRWDNDARAQVPVGTSERRLADARVTIAVPLLHEARLVGTLTVGSDDPDKAFAQQDTELIEMLASTAAAAVVALEHARLDGVRLAARTAQHELNNQLAVARGYAEMLVGAPDLPSHLVEFAEEVKNAADDAARTVRQLRSISHIHEQRWTEPNDTTIDLAASGGGVARGVRQTGNLEEVPE